MNQFNEGRMAALRAYAVLAGNSHARSGATAGVSGYVKGYLEELVHPDDWGKEFREGFDHEFELINNLLQLYADQE